MSKDREFVVGYKGSWENIHGPQNEIIAKMTASEALKMLNKLSSDGGEVYELVPIAIEKVQKIAEKE